MKIIFSQSALYPYKPDEAFAEEYVAAKNAGFETLLFDYDNLSTSRIVPTDNPETIIYRGWMLTSRQYSDLYAQLFKKNYKLINEPQEYENCHYLPDSLQFISNYTPKTIFQKHEDENDIDFIIEEAKIFGPNPVIIKDYVKSEKHYWKNACFVEDATNSSKLREVIKTFIDLRGSSLNVGIVVREYIDLKNISVHSKSNMPLSEEYRLFFLNHSLLEIYNYWEEGEYNTELPDIKQFKEIAISISSNFFTMDIAKTKNDKFIIIELGDGQVAGIPEKEDKNKFYQDVYSLFNKGIN
ncbi:ATP-grasp domain-containing protein [Leadbettera azotonutricia]|uniref:ATP-grasp domain-containing protein n=1 Tax=Leadbettera azotonutricia (strain ATCC BAA-888 / DSM 13862 / ZAS-9) TaxID=545695 RepID=F5YCZ2_LEAAZ|nr:ATP-grasp domain-containing protein [Leadbettera azotonutricia]AEF81480.1 conserved hypothetical protein [Leadbettera azotonutricia ZAS-9]